MKQVTTDTYQPQLNMTPITEGLERGEIYGLLAERIPFISKKECTQRVMDESGVNALLDQLIIIQQVEFEEDLRASLEGAFNGNARII